MLENTFGHKKPDVLYKERVGAYGIGFDGSGRIPVVRAPFNYGEQGYFLLGGGIEGNEKHDDCLKRECLEEAGLSVAPKDFICKGDFYHFVERHQTDFHAIGYFYYMEINGVVAEPTEPDHVLVWLTVEQAREKLFLPHQVWAVEQAFRMFVKQA